MRELRAAESFDKISAAYFAPILESFQLAIDRSPRNRRTLTAPPFARYDSVACEPLPGNPLRLLLFGKLGTQCPTPSHQRPPSGPATRGSARPVWPSPLRKSP